MKKERRYTTCHMRHTTAPVRLIEGPGWVLFFWMFFYFFAFCCLLGSWLSRTPLIIRVGGRGSWIATSEKKKGTKKHAPASSV